jgi:hypothetical protein
VEEAAAATKAKEESDAAAAWRTTHAFPTPRTTTFALPEKAAREGVEDPEGACNAHDFDGAFIRNTVA